MITYELEEWRHCSWPARTFECGCDGLGERSGRVFFRQSDPSPVTIKLTYSDCAQIVSAFTEFCRIRGLNPLRTLAENLLFVLQTEGRGNLWARQGLQENS
jgi:hypothetical protein